MAWLLARATELLRVDGDGEPGALRPAPAQCVAADPRRPDVACAGLADGAVLVSERGGGRWEVFDRVAHPIFSLAMSAWDGSVYAACEPSSFFRWDGAGVAGGGGLGGGGLMHPNAEWGARGAEARGVKLLAISAGPA